jgi:hypothetical protein
LAEKTLPRWKLRSLNTRLRPEDPPGEANETDHMSSSRLAELAIDYFPRVGGGLRHFG